MLASPAGQKEDGSSIPLYMLCLDLAFLCTAEWENLGFLKQLLGPLSPPEILS